MILPRLVQCSASRFNILRGGNRCQVRAVFSQTAAPKPSTNPKSWLLAGTGVAGFSLAVYGLPVAFCHTKPPGGQTNRLTGATQQTKSTQGDDGSSVASAANADHHFDFRRLIELLKENIGYLVAAVGSALVVAFLNIKIPQHLGQIVNIVAATFASTDDNPQSNLAHFLEQIRTPAINMAKLYLGQALMTFTYIYSLACVGKN